jgi:hypothetical protein
MAQRRFDYGFSNGSEMMQTLRDATIPNLLWRADGARVADLYAAPLPPAAPAKPEADDNDDAATFFGFDLSAPLPDADMMELEAPATHVQEESSSADSADDDAMVEEDQDPMREIDVRTKETPPLTVDIASAVPALVAPERSGSNRLPPQVLDLMERVIARHVPVMPAAPAPIREATAVVAASLTAATVAPLPPMMTWMDLYPDLLIPKAADAEAARQRQQSDAHVCRDAVIVAGELCMRRAMDLPYHATEAAMDALRRLQEFGECIEERNRKIFA